MAQGSSADLAERAGALGLAPEVIAALRAQLPDVAARTVAAVTSEVPQYADTLSREMAAGIAAGVEMALAAFLRLAAGTGEQDPGAAIGAAITGAYELGRVEARSHRSVDALLSAYRVGARVAWQEQGDTAVRYGVPAANVADFAALVFAYIDELSAASVAGHTAELSAAGRVRARHLTELGQALLVGEPADVLLARAERAQWKPPTTLTAVLLPAARVHDATAVLDARTLVLSDDLSDGPVPGQTGVLLVPDAAPGRRDLFRQLRGRAAIVGPVRPWTEVASSFGRAVRALTLATFERDRPVDTEEQLTALVVSADPDALADLRAQVLAPLAGLRPAAGERLAATLRSWLLHQGRRSAVAEDLVVHPQTVRYRMTQLRERYGDRLDDPRFVLDLLVALALDDDVDGGPGQAPDPRTGPAVHGGGGQFS
jgi:hypothetical protein